MGVHRLHAENAKKLLDHMRSDLNDTILVYFTSENKMAASGWSIVSAYRCELPESFTPLRGETLPDQSQIASASPAVCVDGYRNVHVIIFIHCPLICIIVCLCL